MPGADTPTRYELVYTTTGGTTFVVSFDAEPEPFDAAAGWTEWRTPDKRLRLNDANVVSVEIRPR